MKLVSVITVNFNQDQVTEELLLSISQENTYFNIEIIVVDNGSNINPIEAWKVKYPSVKFIRSEKNLGFAGGNNIGIKAAKGDYLFLVNNDTMFTEGLIASLVDILDKQLQVGIVSPKILYHNHPEIIQYAGFTEINYYTIRNKCIGQFEKDNGQYNHATGPTGFAHGAAMMIRSEAIKKVGLMAENYFLYYEEMDWCEQIKKNNYSIWVNMQAVIFHKESVSVGTKSALKEYFMNRNRILFARRNAPLFKRWIFYIYFGIVVLPRNIVQYIINKQYSYIKVLCKAIGWNMTHSVNSNYLGYKV